MADEVQTMVAPGKVVLTQGVVLAMRKDQKISDEVGRCLARHTHGDFGDLDPEDTAHCKEAWLRNDGARFMSVYKGVAGTDTTLWVITEGNAPRVTTVLLPEEY